MILSNQIEFTIHSSSANVTQTNLSLFPYTTRSHLACWRIWCFFMSQSFLLFCLIVFVFLPGQPPPREVKLVHIKPIWLTLCMVLVLHTNAKHLMGSAAQKARPFQFQAYSEERLDCTNYTCYQNKQQNHGQVILHSDNGHFDALLSPSGKSSVQHVKRS